MTGKDSPDVPKAEPPPFPNVAKDVQRGFWDYVLPVGSLAAYFSKAFALSTAALFPCMIVFILIMRATMRVFPDLWSACSQAAHDGSMFAFAEIFLMLAFVPTVGCGAIALVVGLLGRTSSETTETRLASVRMLRRAFLSLILYIGVLLLLSMAAPMCLRSAVLA